jgi:hypothetical protein
MKHLFQLPVQITAEEQISIVNFVKNFGATAPMRQGDSVQYIWLEHLFRHLEYDKIEDSITAPYKKHGRSLDFCLRNNLDLPWTWSKGPESEIVQKIIHRLKNYIIKLGRVQVLLQKPGLSIPFHTDLMPGQKYNDFLYQPQKDAPTLENNLHSANDYLTIKIPLTDTFGNNGYPTISESNQIKTYNVKNYAFAINEYEIEHGAQPTGHWRGVILIDALLNLPNIYKDAHPVETEDWKFTEVFHRVMTVHRPSKDVDFVGQEVDRHDYRIVISEYIGKRLKSKDFLGASISFSEDGLTLIKNEFWRSEKLYRDFFLLHEPYILSMMNMYNTICESRGIKATRIGKVSPYADLGANEKIAIQKKCFYRIMKA